MLDSAQHTVQVIESYRDWHPPVDASAPVNKLLTGIPDRYCLGLQSVVLTNTAGLNRQQASSSTKSRNTRVGIAGASGLYHRAIHGKPAYIELFVDNILGHQQTILWRIPLIRELAFSSVLFQEISHHLHATQAEEFRETHDVADELTRLYYVEHHPFLKLMSYVLRPIVRATRALFGRPPNRSIN